MITDITEARIPDVGHLLVPDIVRMCLVGEVLYKRAILRRVHINERNVSSFGLQLRYQGSELCIDILNRSLCAGVSVEEESAQEDGGARTHAVQIVDHGLHTFPCRADIAVLHGVVGADVDENDVRFVLGNCLARLVVYLVDAEPRPTLNLAVEHGAVLARPNHVDDNAVASQPVAKIRSVTIALR